MSAILEALKKLEQEVSEPSGHPLRREIKRHGEWHKTSLAGLMALGVILCGLAGYGVVVLTRKVPVAPLSMNDRQTVVPSKAEPVIPAPEPSPNRQPATASPPYQVKASGKPLGFRNEQEPLAPDREIVAVALEPEPLPEEPSEEAVSPTTFLPDETETLPEAEDTPADRPKPDVVSKIAPGIFNDPEVVLQAISWSPDAARRMAVISGKICRENEQVGGYVIELINPEDVVVSKESVSGRLVFKIR